MACTLTVTLVNGTSATFNDIFVDAYDCEPLYASDTQIPYAQKITVRGTALISGGEAYATFFDGLKNGSGRYASAVLTVGAVDLFEAYCAGSVQAQSVIDSRGFPTGNITTTQVVGTQTALLRFELVTHKSYAGSQTVVAHRWTQAMRLDGAGKMTRTVNGTLHVSRNTTGSSTTPATSPSSWSGRAAYADLFRNAIIPDVPGQGWRRESQEFALDELGTMLTYSFVDKYHTHDLPDGVLVGDMDCSYERTLDNAGYAIVRFSCELEGSQNLKQITGTTGNRKLVAAAVQLAKTRINTNYKETTILRMMVQEKSILTGYAIRFELDARVVPSSSDSLNDIKPLAFMIGNEFTITRTETRAASSYGATVPIDGVATQYGMVPYYIANAVDTMKNTGGTMPTAALFTFTGANTYGSISVAVISNNDGVTAMNSDLVGKFLSYQQQPANDVDGYTTSVQATNSITNAKYDSGIVKLSPMYLTAPEILFQTKRPTVLLTERVEVSRMNQAPSKVYRPKPDDCYMVEEDWRVTFGKYDTQGNRLFTGIYTRTIAAYDVGVASPIGYSTETTASGAQLRRWAAPNQYIRPTMSPTTTNDSQEVLLSVVSTPANTATGYNVPSETFVT